jgi:hypothetical protein
MMPNRTSFLVYAAGFAMGYIASRISSYVQTCLQNLSAYFWPSQPTTPERMYVQVTEKHDFVPKPQLDYSIEPIEQGYAAIQNLYHTYLPLPLQQESEHPPISSQKTLEEEQAKREEDDVAFVDLFAKEEAELELAFSDAYNAEVENI